MNEPEVESVDLKTGLFSLGLRGSNALFILIFIILIADIAVTLWTYDKMAKQLELNACRGELGLYVYTVPRGEKINWDRIPVSMYPCMPSFLYNRIAIP